MSGRRLAVVAGAFGLFLTCSAAATELPDFDFKNWTVRPDIENARMALYRIHLDCSAAGIQRQLSGSEIALCSRAYLELKLSFLHGVSYERYVDMKPSLRATANRKGYDSYRAWLHRHTTMAVD